LYIKPESCDLINESESESEDELNLPDGSLSSFMRTFRQRLQDEYECNGPVSFISINENYLVESLIGWMKNADDKEILKIPCINFVMEEYVRKFYFLLLLFIY
jgi:hypothetical protein